MSAESIDALLASLPEPVALRLIREVAAAYAAGIAVGLELQHTFGAPHAIDERRSFGEAIGS
ncbi:MAG: hypothetical protein M3Q61_01305 [Chloroflexota bacterium]|nr:hypothetical protein [Chloroflexota bacterium]